MFFMHPKSHSTAHAWSLTKPYEPFYGGSQLGSSLKKKHIIDYFLQLYEQEIAYLNHTYPQDWLHRLFQVDVYMNALIGFILSLSMLFFYPPIGVYLFNGYVLGLAFCIFAFALVPYFLFKRYSWHPVWCKKTQAPSPHTQQLIQQSFENLRKQSPEDAQKLSFLHVNNTFDLLQAYKMLKTLRAQYD